MRSFVVQGFPELIKSHEKDDFAELEPLFARGQSFPQVGLVGSIVRDELIPCVAHRGSEGLW